MLKALERVIDVDRSLKGHYNCNYPYDQERAHALASVHNNCEFFTFSLMKHNILSIYYLHALKWVQVEVVKSLSHVCFQLKAGI